MSTSTNQVRSRVPRFAEAAVERARLTVVPRATSRRAARVPFMALVSLLLVGGVAGLLFFNTSMQQASFTATSLEDRAERLEAQRQGLQMELESLRNPQRVAVQAKAMGMVPGAAPAFVRLSDGSVLGEPRAATVDDALRVTPRPTPKPKRLDPKPLVITPAAGSRAAGQGDGAASRTATARTGTTETRSRQQGSLR